MKRTRLGMALTATTAATALVALTACGSSGSSTSAAAGTGSASASGGKSFTIGTQEGGDPSVDETIMKMTLDKLKSEGWTIKETDFTSPATLATAMQQGQVDMGIVAAGTEFSSIDAGFKAKVFLSLNSTDYQMVAKNGLASCKDLNGKVVGIESREGTTGSLVASWLKTPACAGVTPKLTVVPGSSNRVSGMLAGQIDASAIDLQNTLELQQKSKGFGTIASFAQSSQLAAAFYASDSWLSANASLVKTFDQTYVDLLQQGYANPQLLKTEAAKIVTDEDPTLLNETIDQWVKLKLWDPVSGVQPAYINSALKLYGTATPYKTVKSAADVSTTEYVAGLPNV
jgi:ABC-type nitrate/sulfonate/bicarbonate transport system substrate-binding protein